MKRVRPSQSSPAPTALDQSAPLSPFIIRKLAGRKGLIVDSVMKGVDGRRIVRLAQAKSGSAVENPARSMGFTLAEAKRYLDQLPDRR
jgi:hypothetical protein